MNGRLLSVMLTIVAAGVLLGMVTLAVPRIYFAANTVPVGTDGLAVLYASACAIASFIAGGLCFNLTRARHTPDFQLSPPSGALIGKVRDAGIPVDAIAVRESITVSIPSCGMPDGAGWVMVVGLDYDGKGNKGGRSWLMTYCLTGRPSGPDPLVFMEQLDDDIAVTEQIAAAYRGDRMSWQGKPT